MDLTLFNGAGGESVRILEGKNSLQSRKRQLRIESGKTFRILQNIPVAVATNACPSGAHNCFVLNPMEQLIELPIRCFNGDKVIAEQEASFYSLQLLHTTFCGAVLILKLQDFFLGKSDTAQKHQIFSFARL